MAKKIRVRLYVDSLDSPIVKIFREAVDVFTYVYGREAIEADVALSLSRIDLPVISINGIEVIKSKVPQVDDLVSIFIEFYHRTSGEKVIKEKPKPVEAKPKKVEKKPPAEKPSIKLPEKPPARPPAEKAKRKEIKPAPKPKAPVEEKPKTPEKPKKAKVLPRLIVLGEDDAKQRILALNARSAVNAMKILYNSKIKLIELSTTLPKGRELAKKYKISKFPALILGHKVISEGEILSTEKILHALKRELSVAKVHVRKPKKKDLIAPLALSLISFIALILISSLLAPLLRYFYLITRNVILLLGFHAYLSESALIVEEYTIPFSISYALIPSLVATVLLYALSPALESKDKLVLTVLSLLIIILIEVFRIVIIAFVSITEGNISQVVLDYSQYIYLPLILITWYISAVKLR